MCGVFSLQYESVSRKLRYSDHCIRRRVKAFLLGL